LTLVLCFVTIGIVTIDFCSCERASCERGENQTASGKQPAQKAFFYRSIALQNCSAIHRIKNIQKKYFRKKTEKRKK